jgi:DNA-binding NarL/FixJ family response regulator
VDDYEPWCRFASGIVAAQTGWLIIGEASDGLEAVHMAEHLQPDLVLLDIGLPKLNGLEAAHRIQAVAPTAKILFVSENRSRDIVEAALANGGRGYVVKAEAGSDLLRAIKAVLEGKRFVSASLAGPLLVTTAMVSTAHAQLFLLLMSMFGVG